MTTASREFHFAFTSSSFPRFFTSSYSHVDVQSCEVSGPSGLYGPACPVHVRFHVGEKRESSLLQEYRVDGAVRPCEDGWLVSTSFCAYAVFSCSNLLLDSLKCLDNVGNLGFWCGAAFMMSSGFAGCLLTSSCHTLTHFVRYTMRGYAPTLLLVATPCSFY